MLMSGLKMEILRLKDVKLERQGDTDKKYNEL